MGSGEVKLFSGCGARLCCPVVSGPLVTVWRSGLALCILALYIDVIYSIFSSRCCRAGFDCWPFSSTSSALPLAAVDIVQASESPQPSEQE